MTEKMLRQIAKDIALVKKKVDSIESELNDLSYDLHEIRPEYMEKLDRIEKEGRITKEEFENKFGVKI